MARRSDHTREEIHTLAIEAGYKLIQTQGLAGASARGIAKEIGYTVGTLYNVFQNYDELVLHINAKTLQALLLYVSERQKNLPQNLSSIEQAQSLAQAYIDFASENYLNWRALYEFSSTSYADGLPEWYTQIIAQIFTAVAHALDDIEADASMRATHAKIIWASIHGIGQLSLSNKLSFIETQSAKELVNMMVENYLNGLKIRSLTGAKQ